MVAQVLAVGAVGFRFAALGSRLGAPAAASAGDPALRPEGDVYRHAARRAATLGLLGTFMQAVMLWESLPAAASRAHLTVQQAVTSNFQIGAPVWLLVIAILGFAIASSGRVAGWWLAIVGVVLGPLVPLFLGKWLGVVNPLHRLMGGFWIGTLFVLVLAGLGTVLRDERSKERRGQMAADMVNGFSPMALACAGVLVLSGLVTAWRHLTPFSSLWTTAYGWTLIVKLCLVAGVFALGAWNWKRQRPQMGTEGGAVALRRSARAELVVATCVLAATAILISLPSPAALARRARAAGAPNGAVKPLPTRSTPSGVLTAPTPPAP
jgi:putative copper export protein